MTFGSLTFVLYGRLSRLTVTRASACLLKWVGFLSVMSAIDLLDSLSTQKLVLAPSGFQNGRNTVPLHSTSSKEGTPLSCVCLLYC